MRLSLMPAASTKGKPTPRKSDGSRERIRVVAAKLFASNGFHATTMDDVAAAVRLNKATIYYYFSSKSDLLYDLYDQGIELGLDGIRGIAEDTPADEALASLVRYHVNTIATHPHLVAIQFQETGWLPKWLSRKQLAAVRQKEDEYSRFVTSLIERGIEEGTLKSKDPRIATFALVGMMAWSHQWLRPRGPLTPDEVADKLIDVVFNGLGAEPVR
jgi:AcrR family transcriptional regulator